MLENLYYLVEQITVIICLYGLYGKKIKIDILPMATLVINIIIFNVMLQGYIGAVYSIIVYSVVFIFCLQKFKGTIKMTIANLFLCIILITVLQLLCAFPMALLRSFIRNDAMLLLIVNILILFVVIIGKKQLGRMSKYISDKKLLSLLPVFLCFAEIIILIVQFKNYQCLSFDMYFIITTFTILVICLIRKWYESKAEAEQKAYELQVTSIYNEAFDNLVNDVRKRQHDIKNHFNAIFSMHYTYNDYDELVENQKKYCEDIIHMGRFDKLLSLNIPVLAGFLYSKFHSVEECDIQIEYSVKIMSSKLPLPMYEIISILGILIDNAKEKAQELEKDKRIIRVNLYEDENKIYLMIKNISEYIKNSDLIRLFERGYTTKGENRGIGLSTVKEKSLEYGFDVLVENEKVDEYNWIVFGIIMKK